MHIVQVVPVYLTTVNMDNFFFPDTCGVGEQVKNFQGFENSAAWYRRNLRHSHHGTSVCLSATVTKSISPHFADSNFAYCGCMDNSETDSQFA